MSRRLAGFITAMIALGDATSLAPCAYGQDATGAGQFLAAPALGAGAESIRELLAAPALVGDGRWRESAATPAAAPKRWALEVRNDGGALSGVVEIGGSPLVTRAALTGRVEGEGVWGTLRDERGREVATFTGRVTPDGRLHGRYQDRNGEAGTWEWERPGAVAPGER